MFRVPVDPNAPTFDEVFKVGFWRWLTSGKVERNEWFRRRQAAVKTASANQRVRIDTWAERKRRESESRKHREEHR